MKEGLLTFFSLYLENSPFLHLNLGDIRIYNLSDSTAAMKMLVIGLQNMSLEDLKP